MWNLARQSVFTNLILLLFVSRILANESEDCGFNEFKQSIDCYFNGPNVESSWLERNARKGSIYFIDASCNGALSYKQACSVEAAARANPRRQIFVLFAGAVKYTCVNTWPINNLLKIYPNVEILQINVTEYLQGTPFELDRKNDVAKLNVMMYLQDVLTFVTLNKHGGIFVHTNTIVAKPFDELPQHENFVGKEDDSHLGIAVIAFSKSKYGTVITNEVLRLLNSMPLKEALSRSIKKICHVRFNGSSFNCNGLAIYEPDYFYPIAKSDRKTYFKSFKAISSNIPERTHAFHIWGAYGTKTSVESNSVFNFLMKKYCPVIFRSTLRKMRQRRTEDDYLTNPEFVIPHKSPYFSYKTAVGSNKTNPKVPNDIYIARSHRHRPRHPKKAHNFFSRQKVHITTHSLNISEPTEEPNSMSTTEAELKIVGRHKIYVTQSPTINQLNDEPNTTVPMEEELITISNTTDDIQTTTDTDKVSQDGLGKDKYVRAQDIPLINEFFTMRRLYKKGSVMQ